MKQPRMNTSRSRNITRIATLNVYSMSNQMIVIRQYINDWHVDVIVITETHDQEDGFAGISIEGMTRACASSRATGSINGGVAIYVSEAIPCCKEYSTVTRNKNKMEHCAAIIYPNHNSDDRLAVVGIYRPP